MLTFVVLKVPVRAQSSHLHYKKEVEKSRSSRLDFLFFIPVSARRFCNPLSEYNGWPLWSSSDRRKTSSSPGRPVPEKVFNYTLPLPGVFRKALSSFRPQANYLSHNILGMKDRKLIFQFPFIVETHKKFCAKRFFSLSRTIFKSQGMISQSLANGMKRD